MKNGGTLILTFRSGVKDEHNVVTDRTLPGPFADIAGVAIHEFDPQINEEQEIVGPGEYALPRPLLGLTSSIPPRQKSWRLMARATTPESPP